MSEKAYLMNPPAAKKETTGRKRGGDTKVKSESAEPPSKKQKDAQKASSKTVNVPLDEGCASAGKLSFG